MKVFRILRAIINIMQSIELTLYTTLEGHSVPSTILMSLHNSYETFPHILLLPMNVYNASRLR